MQIPLTLELESGEARPATGELIEYSDGQRIGKAVGFLVGGLVLGGSLIVVPILHLITTWALPLAGLIACVVTLRTRSSLKGISGPCPGCEASITFDGGRADEFPLRDACPECSRPLVVRRAEE